MYYQFFYCLTMCNTFSGDAQCNASRIYNYRAKHRNYLDTYPPLTHFLSPSYPQSCSHSNSSPGSAPADAGAFVDAPDDVPAHLPLMLILMLMALFCFMLAPLTATTLSFVLLSSVSSKNACTLRNWQSFVLELFSTPSCLFFYP